MNSFTVRYVWLGFLVLLPLVMGCGPGKGKVKGQVRLDGKGLPGGRATFRPADSTKNSIHADLDGEGNYEVELPVGDVRVSIDNHYLVPPPTGRTMPKDLKISPALKEKAEKATAGKTDSPAPKSDSSDSWKGSGKYVPLPLKYIDADKSGLDFKVESGEQSHNIELKSDPK